MVGHILVEYDTPFSDNPKIQDVGFLYAYRLVNVNSLLLKMVIWFVDLPIDSMVDLSIVMLVYQRVDHLILH